jgi:hypothetical protein
MFSLFAIEDTDASSKFRQQYPQMGQHDTMVILSCGSMIMVSTNGVLIGILVNYE